MTWKNEAVLKYKFKTKEHDNYPHHAIHTWAENKPVNEHNRDMLLKLTDILFTIHELDNLPKQVFSTLNKVLYRSHMDTGGLPGIFKLR